MKASPGCLEREKLFAYSNHLLERGEEGLVMAHVNSCPACHRVVARFQDLDLVLGDWKSEPPSPWFDARARAHLSASSRAWFAFPSLHWRQWAGIAAVVLLIAVSGLLTLHFSRPVHTRPTAPLHEAMSVTPNTRGPARAPAVAAGETRPASGKNEIALYSNLKVLENYDMLAKFDVLSELPRADNKAND